MEKTTNELLSQIILEKKPEPKDITEELTFKAVIKWRGKKKITNMKVRSPRQGQSKKLVYLAVDYCIYLTAEHTYPLSLDGLRNFEELKEACA